MKPVVLTAEQRRHIEQLRRAERDVRIWKRLSAVLWSADGEARCDVAELLDVSERRVGEWLRIHRNRGLDELRTLHQAGDPGDLSQQQPGRLRAEVATGVFRNARQVLTWVSRQFGVEYSESVIKALLRRIGASYHKTTGFLWKADPDRQEEFLGRHARQKAEAGPDTRRYYVDACRPVWGLECLCCCWLLVGQRFLVGVGDGRRRLSILGAYCPDDQEYLDVRLADGTIDGDRFVELLERLRAAHPQTRRFLLYLDNARYYKGGVVRKWLEAHPEFRLEPLPPYSPNLNLIERLWRFLRGKALKVWHKTFEEMKAAVASVLDHLDAHAAELGTLMTGKFEVAPRTAAA